MNCINQMIQTFFHSMNQENMIYLQKHLKKTKEAEHMAYFQVNWNKYTDQLSKIVDKEKWSNNTYSNNGILANYIVKTYDKLISEKK